MIHNKSILAVEIGQQLSIEQPLSQLSHFDRIAQFEYKSRTGETPCFEPHVLKQHVLYSMDTVTDALVAWTERDISITMPYQRNEQTIITIACDQRSDLASARYDVRTLEIAGYRYVIKEVNRTPHTILQNNALVRHCEVLATIEL